MLNIGLNKVLNICDLIQSTFGGSQKLASLSYLYCNREGSEVKGRDGKKKKQKEKVERV